MLNPYDIMGVSFWLMSLVMLLMTVFLFIERQTVAINWRLSISLSTVVMLLTTIHYWDMKNIWLDQQNVAMSYRYLEWMLALPLQALVLYSILQMGTRKDCVLVLKMFLLPTLVLTLGFLAEVNLIAGIWVYILMAALWLCFLHLLWMGDAARAKLAMVNLSGRMAYRVLRWFITVGWLVYPLAYFASNGRYIDPELVNILLNELDCINKIGYSLVVWYAAYKDSGLLHTK